MNNLTLVTTENFGSVECNFYKNKNDTILFTREQISKALGYAAPSKAIRKNIFDILTERSKTK